MVRDIWLCKWAEAALHFITHIWHQWSSHLCSHLDYFYLPWLQKNKASSKKLRLVQKAANHLGEQHGSSWIWSSNHCLVSPKTLHSYSKLSVRSHLPFERKKTPNFPLWPRSQALTGYNWLKEWDTGIIIHDLRIIIRIWTYAQECSLARLKNDPPDSKSHRHV